MPKKLPPQTGPLPIDLTTYKKLKFLEARAHARYKRAKELLEDPILLARVRGESPEAVIVFDRKRFTVADALQLVDDRKVHAEWLTQQLALAKQGEI